MGRAIYVPHDHQPMPGYRLRFEMNEGSLPHLVIFFPWDEAPTKYRIDMQNGTGTLFLYKEEEDSPGPDSLEKLYLFDADLRPGGNPSPAYIFVTSTGDGLEAYVRKRVNGPSGVAEGCRPSTVEANTLRIVRASYVSNVNVGR